MVELTLRFDDIIKDDDGTWSQICESCKGQLSINESLLSDNGSGVCGVIGCENESDHYIDFK